MMGGIGVGGDGLTGRATQLLYSQHPQIKQQPQISPLGIPALPAASVVRMAAPEQEPVLLHSLTPAPIKYEVPIAQVSETKDIFSIMTSRGSLTSPSQRILTSRRDEESLSTPPPPAHDENDMFASSFYSKNFPVQSSMVPQDNSKREVTIPTTVEPEVVLEGEIVAKKKRKRKGPELGEDGLPVKRQRKKKSKLPEASVFSGASLIDSTVMDSVAGEIDCTVIDTVASGHLNTFALNTSQDLNVTLKVEVLENIAPQLEVLDCKNIEPLENDEPEMENNETVVLPKKKKSRKSVKSAKDSGEIKNNLNQIDSESPKMLKVSKKSKAIKQPKTAKEPRVPTASTAGKKRKAGGVRKKLKTSPQILDEATMIVGDKGMVDHKAESVLDDTLESEVELEQMSFVEKPKLLSRPKSKKKRYEIMLFSRTGEDRQEHTALQEIIFSFFYLNFETILISFWFMLAF